MIAQANDAGASTCRLRILVAEFKKTRPLTYNDGEGNAEVVQHAPVTSQLLPIPQLSQAVFILHLDISRLLHGFRTVQARTVIPRTLCSKTERHVSARIKGRKEEAEKEDVHLEADKVVKGGLSLERRHYFSISCGTRSCDKREGKKRIQIVAGSPITVSGILATSG